MLACGWALGVVHQLTELCNTLKYHDNTKERSSMNERSIFVYTLWCGLQGNTHPVLLVLKTDSFFSLENLNHSLFSVTGKKLKSLTTSSRHHIPTDSRPISHLRTLLALIFSYLGKTIDFMSTRVLFSFFVFTLITQWSNFTVEHFLFSSFVFIMHIIDPVIQTHCVVALSCSVSYCCSFYKVKLM